MEELENVMGLLTKKQERITGSTSDLERVFREEEARVEDYYTQFFEILEEHKRRVLQELREEYEAAGEGSRGEAGKVEEALTDSNIMKHDIIKSMHIILNETDEQQYRPIMDNYQHKLRDYKNLSSQPIPPNR